jgi:hypothetical protein
MFGPGRLDSMCWTVKPSRLSQTSWSGQTVAVRLEIHVRPSASSTTVGGEYDGLLVVRVVEPADEGRATDAALRAVAKALAVPRRSVTLVRGTSSRRKLIEIEVETSEHEGVRTTVARLRAGDNR